MEEKIKVEVCSGTVCYVMGGADLLLIQDKLPQDLKEKVLVKGSPCLEFCKGDKNGKPPFAMIDGEMVCEATVTKVIDRIYQRVKRNFSESECFPC